jgi:hypothetical protein
MVASSAAMAADVVKFDVPFAFQAAGKTLAPGTYRLRAADNKMYFTMSNVRTGTSVFMNALSPHDPEKEWQSQNGGILEFACNDGQCALKQLWTGKGHPAVYISIPHEQEIKFRRLALIRSADSK